MGFVEIAKCANGTRACDMCEVLSAIAKISTDRETMRAEGE